MCVCFWPVCQEIEQKDNNYFFIKRKIKNQPHQKTNQTWNIPLCFLSLPCRKGSSTNSFDLGDVNLYKVKILKYFFLVLGFYQEKYVYIIGMLTVPIWTYSGFGKKWLVYFVDSCFEFAAILLFTLSPSCAAFGILLHFRKWIWRVSAKNAGSKGSRIFPRIR